MPLVCTLIGCVVGLDKIVGPKTKDVRVNIATKFSINCHKRETWYHRNSSSKLSQERPGITKMVAVYQQAAQRAKTRENLFFFSRGSFGPVRWRMPMWVVAISNVAIPLPRTGYTM